MLDFHFFEATGEDLHKRYYIDLLCELFLEGNVTLIVGRLLALSHLRVWIWYLQRHLLSKLFEQALVTHVILKRCLSSRCVCCTAISNICNPVMR